MLYLFREKEPDSDPEQHADDFAWFEYEVNDGHHFGMVILRAAGGLKEAKVVFECWFDNKFGDNAFNEANLSYEVIPLDNNGPANVIWTSMEAEDDDD